MDISKKNINIFISAVFSLVGVYIAPLLINTNNMLDYSNSIWPLLIFIVFFIAFNKLLSIDYSGKLKFSTAFGFIISCFLTFGDIATRKQSIATFGLFSALEIVFLTFLFTLITTNFFIILDKINSILRTNKYNKIDGFLNSNISFFIIMGIIIVAWLPMFLANYPGTAYGDVASQIKQYELKQFNGMFPLLHTFFVGFLFSALERVFNSNELAIAGSIFIQMLITSAIIAYIAKFFIRLKSNISSIVAILFFSIHPVILLYSKDNVRDVLFSYFTVFFCILITELVLNCESFFKSRSKIFMLFFVAFIVTGMRTLGFIVVVITTVVAFVYLVIEKPDIIKRIAVFFSLIVLTCGIWNGPIVNSLTIGRSDDVESMSVPINQLVRVRHLPLSEITEQQQQEINSLFYGPSPFYDEDNVDYNKLIFDIEDYNTNSSFFWNLWIEHLVNYPVVYMDAFLQLNTETWYPDTIFDGYSSPPFVPIPTEVNYYSYSNSVAELDSKIEWLFDLQVYISENISFSKIPLVSLLFSPAMMLYILLYCLFYLIYKKAYKLLFVPMIVTLMHVATFFGPVVVLRYNLISFIAVPIAVAFILSIDRIKQSNESNI